MPVADVDQLAAVLERQGAVAHSMPPAFNGTQGRIHQPYTGRGGECLGRVLPGVGLVLNVDPDRLGITKPIPHVYGRSAAMELEHVANMVWPALVEKGDSEVGWAALGKKARRTIRGGAISTYDGIIAARAGGKAQDVAFSKPSITTVANVWSSIMSAAGFPAALTYTAIPGGAAPTNASTGALSFGLTNPTSPDKKYLLTFGYGSASQINTAILADLLVACGSIQGNTNASQTVNSTALTRYTGGEGVLMTFEVTTALGGTAANLTVTYTNQAGTGSRSTGAIAMTTSAIAGRLQPVALGPFMTLQSGDFGVESVQSVQLSASMTAGVFALHLYMPLMWVPGVGTNSYIERDSTTQIDGLSELVTTGGGALGCLVLYVLPSGTSSGILNGFMRTVAG